MGQEVQKRAVVPPPPNTSATAAAVPTGFCSAVEGVCLRFAVTIVIVDVIADVAVVDTAEEAFQLFESALGRSWEGVVLGTPRGDLIIVTDASVCGAVRDCPVSLD